MSDSTNQDPPQEEAAIGATASVGTSEPPWPEIIGSLTERLEEAQRLMARQMEHADQLHAENQRLRGGELRGAVLPLVRDLLRLHDDLGRMVEGAGDERTHDLGLVRVSLLDALARNGLLSIEPAIGEPFDPKLHNAAGVVATEDADRDRTIAAVARVGFRWEDHQLVRAAETQVFKLSAHAPPKSDTTQDK